MMQRISIGKWAFVVCAVSVLVLALMPTPPRVINTGWDKSNHLLAFGAMTWLGCKSFPQRSVQLLLGLVAYGVLIEVLQSFTPNRSAEWLDVLADCFGIALGWLLHWKTLGKARLIETDVKKSEYP